MPKKFECFLVKISSHLQDHDEPTRQNVEAKNDRFQGRFNIL